MRTNRFQRAAALLAVSALACGFATAQTLYKLIDKNGKVTYVDEPPKSFDGQVIPIQIDPNRNKATLTPPPGIAKEAAPAPRAKPVETAADRLTKARERLEAARKELADARENPREGDVRHIGKVGGGARPVFTEEYHRRIATLEEAVRVAEEDVRRAEGR